MLSIFGITIGLSIFCAATSGWPRMTSGAPGLRVEQRFHRGQRHRLVLRDHAALRVAGRHNLEDGDEQRRDHAHAHEDLSLLNVLLAQQIERSRPLPSRTLR